MFPRPRRGPRRARAAATGPSHGLPTGGTTRRGGWPGRTAVSRREPDTCRQRAGLGGAGGMNTVGVLVEAVPAAAGWAGWLCALRGRRELAARAGMDGLTGLANRAGLHTAAVGVGRRPGRGGWLPLAAPGAVQPVNHTVGPQARH